MTSTEKEKLAAAGVPSLQRKKKKKKDKSE
jgi:hypothetical protein